MQAKAVAAMASGALMASIARSGTDTDEARRYAALMLQAAWRGRTARKEMIAQRNASTLIQVGASVQVLLQSQAAAPRCSCSVCCTDCCSLVAHVCAVCVSVCLSFVHVNVDGRLCNCGWLCILWVCVGWSARCLFNSIVGMRGLVSEVAVQFNCGCA